MCDSIYVNSCYIYNRKTAVVIAGSDVFLAFCGSCDTMWQLAAADMMLLTGFIVCLNSP